MRGIALLALVLTVAGCSSKSEDDARPGPTPCGFRGAPLTIDVVTATLGRHGFAVADVDCARGQTMLYAAPDANASLICHVASASVGIDPDDVRTLQAANTFIVANVHCELFFEDGFDVSRQSEARCGGGRPQVSTPVEVGDRIRDRRTRGSGGFTWRRSPERIWVATSKEVPMAVGMLLQMPAGTQEFYDAVLDELGWKTQDFPQGFISHYAGPQPQGGWLVFDVWESQADFERFAQDRLMGALDRAAGGEAPPQDPQFIPIHNQDHARAGVPA